MGLILGRAQTKIPKDIRSLLINRSIVVHTVSHKLQTKVRYGVQELFAVPGVEAKKEEQEQEKQAPNSNE